MNILFLFIGSFESIDQHEIYPDLVRKFAEEGHKTYVVCCNERRNGQPTVLIKQEDVSILRVKIGNITKCNTIEKGISTILIEKQYRRAINKYFDNIKFGAVIYATPPITLAGVIRFVKRRDNAKSYLMLKDIFPQNAVDLSMLKTHGIKGIIYRFFRYKERKLYDISDYIGCMSPANIKYLLRHNPRLNPRKVCICPNCIEIHDNSITGEQKDEIRNAYEIPLDKTILLYGGNLGKPQGIPFLIECIKTQKTNKKVFFLIIGQGTEYNYIYDTITSEGLDNVKLIPRMPTADYERMIQACDIGLVFLDHRFTIPNFPSRILPYMQAKLPVIACTDRVTDLRQLIEENELGWWCESNRRDAFAEIMTKVCSEDLRKLGMNCFNVLNSQYSIEIAYKAIIDKICI